MIRGYRTYDLSTVSQTLNTLATVHLSAFYVDVTKDRMYTLGVKSRQRRSTQTAMYVICDGLARLLAPILPVTADDLWRICRAAFTVVHLEKLPAWRWKDPAILTRGIGSGGPGTGHAALEPSARQVIGTRSAPA